MSDWGIVGNKKQIEYLESLLENDSLHHAYIFAGSLSVGKSIVAKNFSQGILCESYNSPRPCNQCRSCHEFLRDLHPDYFTIVSGDKKNINIEEIRNIRKEVENKPYLSSYQVVFIQNAEKMNISAFNALLKYLEEPPGNTIFILSTNQLSNLPGTIVSRCQIIRFDPVSVKDLNEYLSTEDRSKTKIDEIIRFSLNSPIKASSFQSSEDIITKHKDYQMSLVNSLVGSWADFAEFAKLKIGQSKSIDAEERTKELIFNIVVVLRDIMLLKKGCDESVVNQFLIKKIAWLADNRKEESIKKTISEVLNNYSRVGSSDNMLLALENSLLSFY